MIVCSSSTGQGIFPVTRSPEMETGFIMAMHYSDQMTGASGNVMNLQCFVGHHLRGVKVVEPFLHPSGSTLGVGLSPSFEKMSPHLLNMVKHSDIFDAREWADYAKSREYAPLISWKDFMKRTPKKLILVHHQWETRECNQSMINATKEFVTEHKFKIVRQVCINFVYMGVLTPRELLGEIYGDFSPNEVVVIINHWGGIMHNIEEYRFSVTRATSCYRRSDVRLYHHSKPLLDDVNEYSRRYMNNSSQYVAVMVRIEWLGIHNKLYRLSAEDQRIKLMECFNSIYLKVNSLKAKMGLQGTLITMDVGKHGSTGLKDEWSPYVDISSLNEAVKGFFRTMLLNKDDWEDSFVSVARFNVSGYIAVMQQELAANSVCLILVGGGTFQRNAKALYDEVHSLTSTNCILNLCYYPLSLTSIIQSID